MLDATILTYKCRIKGKPDKVLRNLSFAVNQIWNLTREKDCEFLGRTGEHLKPFDVYPLIKNKIKELSLNSKTANLTAMQYAQQRKQFKKSHLKWRGSNREKANYSLGWIPLSAESIVLIGDTLIFMGKKFRLWNAERLKGLKLKQSAIVEDTRGRWFACLTVEVLVKEKIAPEKAQENAIGIDLGLKNIITTSDNKIIAPPKFYRGLEKKLAIAQRARRKDRVKAIHLKIKNRRKDWAHKTANALIKDKTALFVGNVKPSKVINLKHLAKSVYDAGWTSLRSIFGYKTAIAGIWYKEVDEANTSQICYTCGNKSANSPRGAKDLGKRIWRCGCCDAALERDYNAARNILQRGTALLVAESCA